jgi:signal transduction histidine kinase
MEPIARRYRRIQVRAVGADDVRRFAAQLRPGPLEIRLARHLHDLLADARGAGEGDAVHVHVQASALPASLP